MRILFLTPYPILGASSRFRVYQYVPYLVACGHEVEVAPFLDEQGYQHLYQPGRWLGKISSICASLWRRLRLWSRLRDFDICIIHREAAPIGSSMEWLYSRRARRLVFDFDDAIFCPAVSDSNRIFRFLKSPSKTARLIARSHATIAGNQFLADYARRFCAATYVLPTPVDATRFQPRPAGERPSVVIGWIGSHTTAPYLELAAEPLREVKALYDRGVEIHIVGAGSYCPAGLTATYKSWSLENEIADLQAFDIGIMPMPNTPWAQGKCGFKALQYMSVGIPVVCSPVGANREIVVHGENGLWSRTAEEWVSALRQLIDDRSLRTRMGQAGRRLLEERYSLSVCQQRLEEILREAAHPPA